MRRRCRTLLLKGYCLGALLLLPVRGDAAGSADYEITPHTMTSGGTSTGGLVRCVAGLGDIAGVSVSSVPDIARQGFVAQLYDVSRLLLRASPNPVDEASFSEGATVAMLDDGSILPLAPGDVHWSVSGWPLIAVDTGGTVQAGAVYADSSGRVRADRGGASGSVALVVLDVDPDNFGSYAADGIDDDWQVSYFGLDNTNAYPGMDPDDDEQDNEREIYAMTDPLSSTSALAFWIEAVPAVTDQCDILFSPCYSQRVYTLRACTDLVETGSWSAVTGSIHDSNRVRRIRDANAGPPAKYYRLWISRP